MDTHHNLTPQMTNGLFNWELAILHNKGIEIKNSKEEKWSIKSGKRFI